MPLTVETARKLLKAPPSATPSELRLLFRRMALMCHPDKPGGTHEHFLQLQEAYRLLSQVGSTGVNSSFHAAACTHEHLKTQVAGFFDPYPSRVITELNEFTVAGSMLQQGCSDTIPQTGRHGDINWKNITIIDAKKTGGKFTVTLSLGLEDIMLRPFFLLGQNYIEVDIILSRDYPLTPPTVKLNLPEFLHPNVNNDGVFCCFRENDWTPAVQFKNLLLMLLARIQEPDFDDCKDPNAREDYWCGKSGVEDKASVSSEPLYSRASTLSGTSSTQALASAETYHDRQAVSSQEDMPGVIPFLSACIHQSLIASFLCGPKLELIHSVEMEKNKREEEVIQLSSYWLASDHFLCFRDKATGLYQRVQPIHDVRMML